MSIEKYVTELTDRLEALEAENAKLRMVVEAANELVKYFKKRSAIGMDSFELIKAYERARGEG